MFDVYGGVVRLRAAARVVYSAVFRLYEAFAVVVVYFVAVAARVIVYDVAYLRG